MGWELSQRTEQHSPCVSHLNLKPSGFGSQLVTKNPVSFWPLLIRRKVNLFKEYQLGLFMFSLLSLQLGNLNVELYHVMSWVMLHWVLVPTFPLCKTGDAVPTAPKTGRTLLDRNAMELARCPLHSRYKTLSSCAHCSADSFVKDVPSRSEYKWDNLLKICCS